VITGHAANGGLPDDFDWAGLADPGAMTAVYMPKATIRDLCTELTARGLPPDHPAVAVFDATRPGETVISATLATLSDRLAAAALDAPCIVLIGAGVGTSRGFRRALAARRDTFPGNAFSPGKSATPGNTGREDARTASLVFPRGTSAS
jgi:siroheme synthase